MRFFQVLQKMKVARFLSISFRKLSMPNFSQKGKQFFSIRQIFFQSVRLSKKDVKLLKKLKM
jgi:hypothetical protein